MGTKKARAVGFNHVALEVGDIEEALAFYGRLFELKLCGKSETSAFIDLGDQFLALQKGRTQPANDGHHFGLVVDDKDAVRIALADAGIEPLPGLPRRLHFESLPAARLPPTGHNELTETVFDKLGRQAGLKDVIPKTDTARVIRLPPGIGSPPNLHNRRFPRSRQSTGVVEGLVGAWIARRSATPTGCLGPRYDHRCP